jgi:hypothetical protein
MEKIFQDLREKACLAVDKSLQRHPQPGLTPDNMPPKIDPYATPRAKTFDLFLCVLAIVLMLIAFRSAPRNHPADMPTRSPAAATLATK